MLSVKQGSIKYHFLNLDMIRPGIEPRSPGPLANTLLIRPINKSNDKKSWELVNSYWYPSLTAYDIWWWKFRVCVYFLVIIEFYGKNQKNISKCFWSISLRVRVRLKVVGWDRYHRKIFVKRAGALIIHFVIQFTIFNKSLNKNLIKVYVHKYEGLVSLSLIYPYFSKRDERQTSTTKVVR